MKVKNVWCIQKNEVFVISKIKTCAIRPIQQLKCTARQFSFQYKQSNRQPYS